MGERHSVKLPFKPMTELTPDNFVTSKNRLQSLKHIKENRDISKVRIVFDGSSKQIDQLTWNKLVHSGPCSLPLLYDILLRFRLGTITITADVAQAFLKILVDKKDQDFLQFLWYDDVFSDHNTIVY